MTVKRSTAVALVLGMIVTAAVVAWKPTVLVYGVQRAGLYASIAIPMALVLGIVHIVNLAHGEMLMVAAYLAYFGATLLGLDPYVALLPTALVMAVLGLGIYKLTIKHTLKAPELNQLILTFGLGIALSQGVNLIFTSQSYKMSLSYVSASATIGETSFGIYDFVFVAAAIAITISLKLFLTKTKLGKAALAVGQNPRGAAIIGIDVDRTYGIVFAIAVGLIGVVGSMFLTKQAIFPGVGGPYTMKSFCLVAMAGVGNIPGIVYCSLVLGIAEAVFGGIRALRAWSDIVFFAIIVITILINSHRGKKI